MNGFEYALFYKVVDKMMDIGEYQNVGKLYDLWELMDKFDINRIAKKNQLVTLLEDIDKIL